MWNPRVEAGEEPPLSHQEEEELKDQFQQQQEKIAELIELLRQNEQKLVNKEKEVEQYATKLSDIKSRSKASKRKSATQKQDSSQHELQDPETPKVGSHKEVVSTPGRGSAEKMPKGNLVLLRKKLEENRLKFEQRGKEMSENKKGIEEMVQHLKAQLDERDLTIQELQRGLQATQSPARITEVQEMEEHVTISAESSSQTPEEILAQSVYRDNKVMELKSRIAQLEAVILDLEENVREKDSVIEARTKAITLMSEDFSRRNKVTVDNLEETREEMRKMQNNFVLQEVKMKEENERLKEELATKNSRLLQSEETIKTLESIRFDLSTRNAELQEKVVKVQEQIRELRNGPPKEQDNTRVEDLTRQLDNANKQITKLKAQHKTKVKNWTKQLDGLKQMSDTNEEIVKLQNRVAELEEDKGNLQLHLVDFDELKVSESHLHTRVSELEERVLQQNQDLDSHVHMIALLEAEKLEHMQDICSEKKKVSSLESELEGLKTCLQELENQKVSLEMKTVDLEEQVDILTKEKAELMEEMKVMSCMNQGVEDSVTTPTLGNDSDTNSFLQSVELVERQEEGKELIAETQDLNKSLEQLKVDLLNSNKVIEEQREIIMDLKSKIDSRDELEMQNEVIKRLEHLGDYSDRDDRIAEIVTELQEVAGDLEEWKTRCTEVEKRLQDLGEEKMELEECFKEVKCENLLLNQELAEQRDIAADLVSKLQEQSNAITGRDERISSLQSLIEINGHALEAREMTLKDVHERLNSVEKQYELRLSELKLTVANKEKELLDMTSTLAKQENILKDKESQIIELNETLQKQSHEFASLQHQLSVVEENVFHQFRVQLDKMSVTLAQKDELNCQLAEECHRHRQNIDTLTAQLEDRVQYIMRLEVQTEEFKEVEQRLQTAESSLKRCEEELCILKQDLTLKQSEVTDKMDKLTQVEGKVTELTEKNKKFVANLKVKAVTIKGHEQKLQQYEAVVQAKEKLISELEVQNEKLLEQQADKANLEQQLKMVSMLTEERSRTELMGDRIITLESELKASEAKVEELSLMKEACMTLTTKVSELEQEIIVIQLELRSKNDQIMLLEKDKVRLIEEGKTKEQEEVSKCSVLEDKIKELETELVKQRTESLEKLEAEKKERQQQVLSASNSVAKVIELEEQVKSRDQRITELQEQLVSSSERNQQSLSAIEAKLQEREAVVESLEQELLKSTERVQHLEEGLAFVEERHQSLENKAETLSIRLQESDRVKEEVFENEEMLEQRLTVLIASEESQKKKYEILNRANEESTQRIAELTAENLNLRKEVVNTESNLKGLQKELERLSPFEFSFLQASEKVETLEADLKRVVAELENRMKEKVQAARQHAENLETDLRNVNTQLEHVELEKRTLMEQYEKLNDERMNLEDDIERLNQVVEGYKQTNADLKEQIQKKLSVFESTITEKEVARKELEERIYVLETELQGKTSAYEEKELVLIGMNEKIGILETELKLVSSAVDTAASEKEEIKNKLNERTAFLEKELDRMISSFEIAAVEKDKIHSELQETIRSQEAELKRYQHMLEAAVSQPQTETDSDVSQIVSEESIASLNAELHQTKLSLTQKDNEIKNYQTRLLQLQFGYVQDGGHDSYPSLQDKVSHLEDSNIKLQEAVRVREAQISDLNTAVTASNVELEQLQSELKSYHTRMEELMKHITILEEEAVNKNNCIEQLQMALAETHVPVPPQLESITHEYEIKFSSLEKHNDELFHELLKTKAQQEVEDIVRVAEERVRNINKLSADPDNGSESVKFQEPVQAQSIYMNMEDQVKALEEELWFTRSERDAALLRITELSCRIPPSSGDIVMMLEDGAETSVIKDNIEINIPWQQTNRAQMICELERFADRDIDVIQQVVAPERGLNLGSSSWDVCAEGEGEGWCWGSEEARLEAEHIQKQKETLLCADPSDVLKDRLVTLENHITNIQAEKEKLVEELHTAQVRNGKMLKKLKDLKLKNDSLLKENVELAQKVSDKNFSDLDQAIEEELKIRIDTLEKELKEIINEKDTACSEKERLESHIDMLTCANERLVEMKERQDIDIEVWKQRNRDLSNQVQSLEWRIGELVEENKSVMESHASREQDFKELFFSWDKHGFTPDSTHFIDIDSLNNELQEKVSALSADNESLQELLEQQRNLRVAAETELQKLQQKVAHTDAETQFYAEENNSFKEQLQVEIQQKTLEELKGECGSLEEKNNNLQNAYHALKTEYDRMCTESEECVLATERKCEALQCEYTKKIEDICNETDKIEEYYRNVLRERDQLAEDLQKLSKNLVGLTQQHETLKSEYSILREHTVMHEKTLALAVEQKGDLEQELAQLKSETDSISLRLSDTPGLLSEQKMRIAELEMELQTKTEEIERLRQLIESQKLDRAEVEQEWNGRVERLRKELELSAEDVYKQQDRYSMLVKEYQELRDHNSEIIQCHVQEAVHAKEQEIERIKAQLMEKETRFVMEIEERPKEDPKYKFDETSDLLTARDRDIEILNIRLTQKEKEIEEIFSVKDKDIQNLKIMLSENERKFEELLGQKDQDIYNLRVLLADNDAKISELQQTLDEEARQLTELRELLEDRELQLRQLNDELLVTKHNEAQALSVLPKQPHDSFSSSLTDKNQSSLEHHVDRRGRKDSSASETQQGELDLALYMLHQRDVRCDELTLELMQLLEERDTLQLRLSNALRMNEELRTRNRTSVTSSPDKTAGQMQLREQMPQNIEAAISLPPSPSTRVQEPQEDLQGLSNKLSQLHSIGYHRDVTLQDEREQRHNEQMRLLHQRGSGIVVDASYTLSRDVQSPSTVLLNWIWGRSTPRVMHV